MSPAAADEPARAGASAAPRRTGGWHEASIAEVGAALDGGRLTAVSLAAACLDRIGAFDRGGILLNAVPVLNPDVFAEARASDERRARGESLGPLDGVPFTAKDSFSVRGLPVAAGSPAFADLVARHDAFAIERLRGAGAVLIGLTNMPALANGGMQRGLYGRAESPYSADHLASAYASGSSNGSGVATAAGFATFGLGEETWSSGRAPASCNALVAYTPSNGVISVRGNWPLTPPMDVVVPHTRSVPDLLAVLDVLVADDAEPRGDFWRVQPWVEVPAASDVRPTSYAALPQPGVLAGRRFGVPRMYVGADDGIAQPIETRPSVLALWEAMRADLEAAGAQVVEVDFPLVSNEDRDRPGAATAVERGLVPADFPDRELWDLSAWALDDLLRSHDRRLADADPDLLTPRADGELPDRYGHYDFAPGDWVRRVREHGVADPFADPVIGEGLRGYERARRADLDEWLDANGLDALVFPALADVAPATADRDPAAADLAWRNGTWVANGNLVPRRFGLPTVTIPMGTMPDTGMPVGLTILGRPYDDSALLRYGWAAEALRDRRTEPPRTPPLPEPPVRHGGTRLDAEAHVADGRLTVRGATDAAEVRVTVNGAEVSVERDGEALTAEAPLPPPGVHSQWDPPYGPTVVVTAGGYGALLTPAPS